MYTSKLECSIKKMNVIIPLGLLVLKFRNLIRIDMLTKTCIFLDILLMIFIPVVYGVDI